MADERIRLDLDLNQFTASAREGTQALQSMAVMADQNVVPALKNVDAAADQVAASKRRLGSVIMDVNYIVQDFTSQIGTRGMLGGLNAIQNNIPNLIRDLGGTTGLGATIGLVSIAAVGAGQAIGAIASSSKEAAAATKELADAAERLAKLKPAGEEKATSEIEQFIKESRGGSVLQGIQSSLQRRARPQAAAMVRESIEQFGVVQETEEQILARWAPQILADAQRAFTGMAQNDQDLGFVMQLAQENPGAFPRNFAQDLQSFTPAARAAADAEERATEAFGERARRGRAGRARRATARELTTAGEENEAIWRNQMADAAGLEARGGTGGLPGFGSAMMEAYRRRMQGGGFDDAAVEAARQAGALDSRFGGMRPGVARQRANDAANIIGARRGPNAIDPQGNPVFDPRVDALMQEVETLQGLTERSHKYISREVERLNRIRAKSKHLEQQSQQLNQTTLDRGR